jgi:hypothetical protein
MVSKFTNKKGGWEGNGIGDRNKNIEGCYIGAGSIEI